MLGDLRILATGDELLLDTERVALQDLFNMIRRFSIGYDVELHKRTLERGLLSLVGPGAGDGRRCRRAACGRALRTCSCRFPAAMCWRARSGPMSGSTCCAMPATLTRCGPRSRTRAPSAVAEAAVECLRVERGRPRYGIDLDDSVIPQEAGLNERAVSFTKGCYVGQETVARLYYRGKPNRQLRGLRLSAPASPGDELSVDGRVVGRLATVAQSPRLGPIALALVRREAPPGTTVAVAESGDATAEVIELPFPALRTASPSATSRQRLTVGPRLEHQLRRLGVRGEVVRDDPQLVDLVRRDVRPELAGAAAALERRLRSLLERVGVRWRRRERRPSRRDGRRPARTRPAGPNRPDGGPARAVARTCVASSAPPSRSRIRPSRCKAPAQPRRTLVLLLLGRRPHLRPDVAEQPVAAVGFPDEQPERLVEPAPVQVRIEVSETRRQAAPHLPVRRRMLAEHESTAAMAKSEQRVELLDELVREPPAPQRPDRDGVAGRRVGRHLEDRERDVEAAADVAEPLVLSRQADVAGRAMLLDQAVLEHERAQLRVRALVVDDRGLDGPIGRPARRREVGAGAAPDRDRLADVQHAAGVVAEQVHARVLRQLREIELRRDGERRHAALAARRALPAPAGDRERVGDRQRVGAQPREQRAQDAGARLGVGERPVRGLHLDPERVREHAQPAPVLERQQLARQRRRAQDGRVGPLEADPLERAGAARGGRTARCAPPAPGLGGARPSCGSTASRPGASATISCVIPVNRWMPRPSGRLQRTSEDQRSCSSPPPTSTAPTSVISQASPPRPLVSVSTTRNSALAIGCSSRVTNA